LPNESVRRKAVYTFLPMEIEKACSQNPCPQVLRATILPVEVAVDLARLRTGVLSMEILA